ncbi:MAG: hypothetical protein ACRCZY_10520, partial [Phocaeicola sp.]
MKELIHEQDGMKGLKSKPSVNSVYYSCFFLLTFVAKTKSMVYWNLAYFKHLYEEYITSGT